MVASGIWRMTASANEIMTLATKAAIGAGATYGQASLFGKAAMWHLIAERPDSALENALDALPLGPIPALPLAFAKIGEAGGAEKETGCVPDDLPLSLVLSYAQALPCYCEVKVVEGRVEVTLCFRRPALRHTARRVDLPDALRQKMTALAARTLVPENDVSRRAGAGAGLLDND